LPKAPLKEIAPVKHDKPLALVFFAGHAEGEAKRDNFFRGCDDALGQAGEHGAGTKI
jgi:hypothetical protein